MCLTWLDRPDNVSWNGNLEKYRSDLIQYWFFGVNCFNKWSFDGISLCTLFTSGKDSDISLLTNRYSSLIEVTCVTISLLPCLLANAPSTRFIHKLLHLWKNSSNLPRFSITRQTSKTIIDVTAPWLSRSEAKFVGMFSSSLLIFYSTDCNFFTMAKCPPPSLSMSSISNFMWSNAESLMSIWVLIQYFRIGDVSIKW